MCNPTSHHRIKPVSLGRSEYTTEGEDGGKKERRRKKHSFIRPHLSLFFLPPTPIVPLSLVLTLPPPHNRRHFSKQRVAGTQRLRALCHTKARLSPYQGGVARYTFIDKYVPWEVRPTLLHLPPSLVSHAAAAIRTAASFRPVARSRAYVCAPFLLFLFLVPFYLLPPPPPTPSSLCVFSHRVYAAPHFALGAYSDTLPPLPTLLRDPAPPPCLSAYEPVEP